MAEDIDAQQAAALLYETAKLVETCCQVAAALVETHSSWARGGLLSLLAPTEYERARAQVLRTCEQVVPRLRRLRRKTLSPDAIRAGANISTALTACRQCPAVNRRNLAEGKPFRCLTRHCLQNKVREGFRFSLDGKGQILEKH